MAKTQRKDAAASSTVAHGFEFGGPVGALLISIGLPILCYIFAFVCNDVSGCPAPSLLSPRSIRLEAIKSEVGWPGFAGLINLDATVWTLAYYGLSLLLQVTLPGTWKEGVELKSGGKLQYKFNAFTSAIVVLGAAGVGTYLEGANFILWTFIWNNYLQLLTVNILISILLATFVYGRSFSVKKGNQDLRELAPGGHSGNIVYDWFIGRELNPRIALPLLGTIDIKAFCELRPGMLGWVLLNLAFMAHQYSQYGSISDSMILITGFQLAYVLDALYMESAILTTMDITTDGFGFMLAFGDLVWLPFIYSLQARYLAVYPVVLGQSGVIAVLAVQAIGYYIFRSANNEKNRFRTNPDDPSVSHLRYITTKSGSRLLTSGWWGMSRHPNYLGDWIMAWSYCLPTGLAGYVVRHTAAGAEISQDEAKGWGMTITYFYLVYFAILLIHRALRDDEKCAKKYGADWETYKQQVKYRIVPYIY